ncbi:hypothetical protein MY4824_003359 [Beauveria thailandica]
MKQVTASESLMMPMRAQKPPECVSFPATANSRFNN